MNFESLQSISTTRNTDILNKKIYLVYHYLGFKERRKEMFYLTICYYGVRH